MASGRENFPLAFAFFLTNRCFMKKILIILLSASPIFCMDVSDQAASAADDQRELNYELFDAVTRLINRT